MLVENRSERVLSLPAVNGLDVWNGQIKSERIPGSSRVPFIEIARFFEGKTQGKVGLDLGSGKGRSTSVLKEALAGISLTALDLSLSGLQSTQVENRVQATAEVLPFSDEVFDFINVCGVFTNLVAHTPIESLKLRAQVMSELSRVLKKDGCLVISDFSALHQFDSYKVNYNRHALITQEYGTIAVLRHGENFVGKTDDDLRAMRGTDAIERFAHHYTPDEFIRLINASFLKMQSYTVELGQTPSGNDIENIILTISK
ncbi:MAG: class I SAM-dependent methyltransferase [Pseudomonadales bacterium]|nr:class I SAM-dependent methyltransferase [Pseudomonadales bacterium]